MPYLGHMTTNEHGAIVPEWTRGDRFRKARELTGLDQGPFAEVIGVSRGTVSSAENNGPVRKITANAWAMATHVDRDWLLTGHAAGNPTPTPGASLAHDAVDRLVARKRRDTARRGASGATRGYAAVAA